MLLLQNRTSTSLYEITRLQKDENMDCGLLEYNCM
jgi:hypothetical protein